MGTITKLFISLITGVALQACSGSSSSSEKSPAKTTSTTAISTSSTSSTTSSSGSTGPLVQVAPITEAPLPENNGPVIALNNYQETGLDYVSLNSEVTFDVSFSDADGEQVTNALYSSNSSLECNASNIHLWKSEFAISSQTFTYQFASAENFFFCITSSDGVDTSYQRIPRVFTVLDTSGMQLWLKADGGVTSGVDGVSFWEDLSGLNHNATQADSLKMPELITDEDGKNAISFDGTNYFLDSHSYTARTVLAVIKPDSSSGNTQLGQIWGSYNEGVHVAFDPRNNGFSLSFDGNTPNQARFVMGESLVFSGFTAAAPSGSYTDQTKQMITVEFDADRPITVQEIGYLLSGTHLYRGSIYELIVFDKILDNAALESYQATLSSRWLNSGSSGQPPPSTPLSVTALGLSNSVNITWDKNGSSSFSIVYKDGDNSITSCTDGTVVSSSEVGNTDTYLILGLADASQYSFAVCSSDEMYYPGQIEMSQRVTATTLASAAYPTDGLVSHLDASLLVTENSGIVSGWQDRASGKSFIQPAGISSANYSATSFNGNPGFKL